MGMKANREINNFVFIILKCNNLLKMLCFQARPLFKDRRKFCQMADPVIQGRYPPGGLRQALAGAAMCVQEQPNLRPVIADVVTALNYLASQKFDPMAQPVQSSLFAPSPPRSERV